MNAKGSTHWPPGPRPAEKRLAVEKLLEARPDRSDRKIAAQAGCSPAYVGIIRDELRWRKLGTMPVPAVAYVVILETATLARLRALAQREKEARDLTTVSEFSRWVLASGIPELCESQGPSTVRATAKALAREISEEWIPPIRSRQCFITAVYFRSITPSASSASAAKA